MAEQCNAGIYEIVNLTNGKRYIGSSVNLRRRWRAHLFHLNRGTHHSVHLQQSWLMYGCDAFVFRVILACERAELLRREQTALDELVPEYNRAPKAGAPIGIGLTESGRLSLSQRMMGNTIWVGRKHSPETIERMSMAHKGNSRTKGRKRSAEAIAKTAIAHTGSKRSAETKARISGALAGKKRAPFTAETRAKLSAALKGRVNSPEAIEKMRQTKRGSKLSARHKANIGASSRRAWAARKAAAAM